MSEDSAATEATARNSLSPDVFAEVERAIGKLHAMYPAWPNQPSARLHGVIEWVTSDGETYKIARVGPLHVELTRSVGYLWLWKWKVSADGGRVKVAESNHFVDETTARTESIAAAKAILNLPKP